MAFHSSYHAYPSPIKQMTVDGPCLVRVDISLASQQPNTDLPNYLTATPIQTHTVTPISAQNHHVTDHPSTTSNLIETARSQSLPITPVLSAVHPSTNRITQQQVRTTANSMSTTPTHSFVLSPIPSNIATFATIRSPLQLATNNPSLTSTPRHLLAGLPTPVSTLSSNINHHRNNNPPYSSDYRQICPIDFSSNTILTFVMSEINTINDIIKVLKHRGVHITEDCKCWIYAKPAVITHETELESNHSHSLHFDFADLDLNATGVISKSARHSNDVSSMHCVSLESAINTTLGSYVHIENDRNKSIRSRYNPQTTNEYSLEIHFERNQWKTNLEVAIENQDIQSITNIIKTLKIPFWTFEQVAKTVGYLGTPSNRYQKHIKGYMIQSIENAVKFDKVLCLHAVFKAANVIKELSNECMINRSRTINCLCYYFSTALKYQSKKCIKFILFIWLTYIGESLEESGIFQKFMNQLLKQLYYAKLKMKRGSKRDVDDEGEKISERQYNKFMSFMTWISSVIEPSMLSDDLFQSFNDDDLFYSISIGRKKRYNYIKEIAKKSLGTVDLAGIILDYDGYHKGKPQEICV